MRIHWTVRCFNRKAKESFDRHLFLDTDTDSLDAVTRSRVELCIEQRSTHERQVLKYRHFFKEAKPLSPEADIPSKRFCVICVRDYFEDEDGQEISLTQIVRIREGNDNLVVFPSHYRPHDIVLSLSENSPVPENPQDHVNLGQEEIDALAYFVKDVVELKGNAFYSSPPTLTSVGGVYSIRTISVEHIVAFMTIFRRLYMQGERGNYMNACPIYAHRYLNKRLTTWITAERRLYNKFLAAKATLPIMLGGEKSFTNRTLIDTMLTVRFAHQPKDDLQHEYETCLREAGDGRRLEWMFYTIAGEAALYYSRAHSVISNELEWYLRVTGKRPTFDFAPYRNESGRGEQPTAEQAREERVRRQAEKLGGELWEEAGRPERQLERFVKEAQDRLRE